MRPDRNLPDLDHLPEVQLAIVGDVTGRLLGSTAAHAEAARGASSTAAVIRELAALAAAAGVGSLDTFTVRASSRTAVVVVRSGTFIEATLDPAQGTQQVERALGEWMSGPTLLSSSELQVIQVEPGEAEGAPSPAGEGGLAGEPASSLAQAVAQAPDGWATLRRLLVRGQLTEASAMRGALVQGDDPEAAAGPEAPEDGRGRALDTLLAGIGSVLSGDALGGLRSLREVASEAQRNPTFRWLALHWGTFAAIHSGNAPVARSFARQAVLAARELDPGAQAVSSWAAAEVLLAEGNGEKALQWVAQARVQFERGGDAWGLGRACFAEARILGAMQRDDEASEAARRASRYDADWDEPPVFLARRCLVRGAVDEAEERVRGVGTASAERVRLVAQAVRQGALGQADAVELLRHLEAAPSADSARALARISQAVPRLAVPREALAWMLLKAGRYAEAGRHFTALAAAPLPSALRSSVMLGLGCVAHAQRSGQRPESRLRAALRAEVEPTPPEAPTPPALSSSAVVPASGAVFSGRLNLFAVPDLLEFLRGARRTGLLLCSAEAGTSALRFREGRIAAAASPSTPGVGELLIRSRKLSPVVLEAVLQRQEGPARTDGVLGEILVREGLVTIEDVRTALREQIRLVVRELVGWQNGEFAFNHDEGSGGAEIAVEVDPQEVLLDVLREIDEAARSRTRT